MKAKPIAKRQQPRSRLEVVGVCGICGCTDEEGCAEGCGWADRRHTLCSVCQDLDEEEAAQRTTEAIDELGMEIDFAAQHLASLELRRAVLLGAEKRKRARAKRVPSRALTPDP